MAKGKFKTRDKLKTLGVTDDDSCSLCTASVETVHHLFFECSFSQCCLEGLRKWLGIKFKPLESIEFKRYKLNVLQQHASTVYHIWHTRIMNSYIK